mgnify:CR=1 FL=1
MLAFGRRAACLHDGPGRAGERRAVSRCESRGRRGDRKDGNRRGGWGGTDAKAESNEENKVENAPEEEEKKADVS